MLNLWILEHAWNPILSVFTEDQAPELKVRGRRHQGRVGNVGGLSCSLAMSENRVEESTEAAPSVEGWTGLQVPLVNSQLPLVAASIRLMDSPSLTMVLFDAICYIFPICLRSKKFQSSGFFLGGGRSSGS